MTSGAIGGGKSDLAVADATELTFTNRGHVDVVAALLGLKKWLGGSFYRSTTGYGQGVESGLPALDRCW